MYDHDSFYGKQVPQHTLEGIDAYAQDRRPPGDFVRAVMENNLFSAAAHADPQNQAALFAITGYVYNEIPSNVWGSPEKVQMWLDSQPEPKGG